MQSSQKSIFSHSHIKDTTIDFISGLNGILYSILNFSLIYRKIVFNNILFFLL